MIEVEIRGRLSQEERMKLKGFLESNGSYVGSHEREMILLTEVEGYSANPVERTVDVRLRCTNGECEIMIKHKASKDNSSREEKSIKLADTTLDGARELLKVLGYSKGILIHRKKEIYTYRDIEWSLVEAPLDIFYFEAEQEAPTKEGAEGVRQYLVSEANKLDLKVFTEQETAEFVKMLNEKVNKGIEL